MEALLGSLASEKPRRVFSWLLQYQILRAVTVAVFKEFADAFLSGEGLPFADVLSAERIERIFRKHGCLFGLHGVYTTATMAWSSSEYLMTLFSPLSKLAHDRSSTAFH